MCEACQACQTCDLGEHSRNPRNNQSDHGDRDEASAQKRQRGSEVNRQLDRGTLRLFESAMNGHEMAHELTQELSYTVALEGTSWAPDAASLMDHFLEQLELLIASCTIAADQLSRQNVEVRGKDPASVFVFGACEAYRRLFDVDGLEFSRDADYGRPTGPLIRFLDACCRVVLDEADMKTAEALAADVAKFRARAKARKKG